MVLKAVRCGAVEARVILCFGRDDNQEIRFPGEAGDSHRASPGRFLPLAEVTSHVYEPATLIGKPLFR